MKSLERSPGAYSDSNRGSAFANLAVGKPYGWRMNSPYGAQKGVALLPEGWAVATASEVRFSGLTAA